MVEEKTTVLRYLEDLGKILPVCVTIQRTKTSRYQFYLAVRHWRKALGVRPIFVSWSKSDAARVAGTLEEFSVWGEKSFYVLEGFTETFVRDLRPAPGVYVLAETENAEVGVERYTYRSRRDILKILMRQLNIKGLSLRALLAKDWSAMSDFEDFEGFFRMARLMKWDVDQIGVQLEVRQRGNLLVLLKKGNLKELLELLDQKGPNWICRVLENSLGEVARFKAMQEMGWRDERVAREMGLGYYRAREVEGASSMLTFPEMEELVRGLVKWDSLMSRHLKTGLEMLLMKPGIGVRR
jgi:hypothetical protein